MVSMVPASEEPMPEIACAVIHVNASSRACGVSCLLSRMNGGTSVVRRMHAAATTGPASAPRPASSMPAMMASLGSMEGV